MSAAVILLGDRTVPVAKISLPWASVCSVCCRRVTCCYFLCSSAKRRSKASISPIPSRLVTLKVSGLPLRQIFLGLTLAVDEDLRLALVGAVVFRATSLRVLYGWLAITDRCFGPSLPSEWADFSLARSARTSVDSLQLGNVTRCPFRYQLILLSCPMAS